MGLFELADEKQNGHVSKDALIEAIQNDLKVQWAIESESDDDYKENEMASETPKT